MYVDGFNLYYRLYKNSRRSTNLSHYKWLDLRAVGETLIDSCDTLDKIYYCSAAVINPPWDPDMNNRQRTFWRALRAHCSAEIVEGNFIVTTKNRIPVDTINHGNMPVEFNTREEKGTDVNLAALIVRDAFDHRCERAILVSSDSDLALAVAMTVIDGEVPVHIASPDTRLPTKLQNAASTFSILDDATIKRCQMPSPVIEDNKRQIFKPKRW